MYDNLSKFNNYTREQILLARKQLKLTQEELAKKIGMSSQSYSRWERGFTKNISVDFIAKIADLSKKSIDSFFPPREAFLADRVISLSKEEKENFKQMINEPIHIPYGSLHPVPVFDANCGKFIDWTDGSYPAGHYPETELSDTKDQHAFFVRAHGDSMTGKSDDKRSIFDGDLLLVEPGKQLSDGDIAFCRHEEKGVMVKRIKIYDKEIHLIPLNEKFKTIILTKKDCCRCFRITEIRRKF